MNNGLVCEEGEKIGGGGGGLAGIQVGALAFMLFIKHLTALSNKMGIYFKRTQNTILYYYATKAATCNTVNEL